MKTSRIALAALLAVGLGGISIAIAQNDDAPATDPTSDAAAEPAAGADQAAAAENWSFDERVSYAIGVMFGSQLVGADFELGDEQLIDGFRTAMAGEELAMTQQEIGQVLQMWQQQQMAKAQEKMAAEAAGNRAEAEQFLAEVAEKDGVKKTDSGLLYKVHEKGTGEKGTRRSKITVHYEGRLPDGTVFDKSQEGKPFVWDLAERPLIPAWMEAITMMREGAKWTLYVPPSLGYGDRGAGEIPPGSALVFDLELIEVDSPATTGEVQEAAEPMIETTGEEVAD